MNESSRNYESIPIMQLPVATGVGVTGSVHERAEHATVFNPAACSSGIQHTAARIAKNELSFNAI